MSEQREPRFERDEPAVDVEPVEAEAAGQLIAPDGGGGPDEEATEIVDELDRDVGTAGPRNWRCASSRSGNQLPRTSRGYLSRGLRHSRAGTGLIDRVRDALSGRNR